MSASNPIINKDHKSYADFAPQIVKAKAIWSLPNVYYIQNIDAKLNGTQLLVHLFAFV